MEVAEREVKCTEEDGPTRFSIWEYLDGVSISVLFLFPLYAFRAPPQSTHHVRRSVEMGAKLSRAGPIQVELSSAHRLPPYVLSHQSCETLQRGNETRTYNVS